MYWPSPQDYSEAVQSSSNFADEQLCSAIVETTALGLPRSLSGNFATVFCFNCHDRKVALRCFLRNVCDQSVRYKAISKYVLADDLICTVPVEYIEQGIRINGAWYPVLKMEWVEGLTLNEFINRYLKNQMALQLLASYFKEMTLSLRRAGIAHGDLQHDNILISDSELRLVDYDGMYVPELASCTANELGHINYQHPGRAKEHYGTSLDNFSAWVIYLSLTCLSIDPDLWQLLDGGADCLLFRHTDFTDPITSSALKTLLQHRDVRIKRAGCMVKHILEFDPLNIPFLDAIPRAEVLDRMLPRRIGDSGHDDSADVDQPWYQQSAISEIAENTGGARKSSSTAGGEPAGTEMPPLNVGPPAVRPSPPRQGNQGIVASQWIKELGKPVIDELNRQFGPDEILIAGVKLDRPISFGLVTNQRAIIVRYWLKFDYIPLEQIGEIVVHKPGLFAPHACVFLHAEPSCRRLRLWQYDPIELQGTDDALKTFLAALPTSIPRSKGF
jgi:serine/threonine protein kinase